MLNFRGKIKELFICHPMMLLSKLATQKRRQRRSTPVLYQRIQLLFKMTATCKNARFRHRAKSKIEDFAVSLYHKKHVKETLRLSKQIKNEYL